MAALNRFPEALVLPMRIGLAGGLRPGYSPRMRFDPNHVLWMWLCCFFSAAACLAQGPEPVKPKVPVAMVGGQAIYEDDLMPGVEAQLLKLQNQEYELKRKALDSLIEQKLLELAAKKSGTTTDKLLEQDVDAKVFEPSDAELQAYYLGQKDRQNRPFADVKEQLRASLKQAKIQEARQDYMKWLRKGGQVTVFLAPPKVQVSFDAKRLRGSPKAQVMIVEFSDYQCPYCRRVEGTLKELLANYGDRVSLAYRDFPLPQLHPQAELAAEASRCAGEQGKFWEYHDQLISATKLEHADLLGYARALKLDEKQFDSCVTSQKYRAEIQRDLQEGTEAGVSGTPGFFINGVPFSGAQSAEAFTRVIEEELARQR
jgi:protein-disulfide isomerase